MADPIDDEPDVGDDPAEDLDPVSIRARYPGLSVADRRRKFRDSGDRHRALAAAAQAAGRPLLVVRQNRLANACDAKLAALGG